MQGVEGEWAEIKKWMEDNCREWCFQLEQGEQNGRFHWQGRMALKVKHRKGGGIVDILNRGGSWYCAVTSENNVGNFWYCSKDHTRVKDMRWCSQDTEQYIPRQIREVKTLYKWQQKLLDMSIVWDTRTVDCIIEKRGGVGKTWFCSMMDVAGHGVTLPFCNDYKEILAAVLEWGKKDTKCYMIDIPRAISKERLFQMWGAIETVKSGMCYDHRYKARKEWRDCPRIYVFMNEEPDVGMLSRDRWKYWTITREMDLEPYQGSGGGALLEVRSPTTPFVHGLAPVAQKLENTILPEWTKELYG